jgi:hypothetical protein
MPPGIDGLAGIGKICEPMLVPAVVPERAVEAFDKCILHGLASLNEVQFGATSLTPAEHRFTGQFAAIVANQNFG